MESTYYTATARLRRITGMRGYGVYCRLVELCNSTPQRKAKYDLEDFAYDMHEESEFVRQIAEDFNLFTIEDGTIADSFTKTPEFQEKERQEQIRRNRREGAKKAAQTRRAKKALQEQKTTVKNIQAPEKRAGGVVSPQEPQATEEYDGDFLNRFNDIRNFWNETFKRKAPRRVVPESDFNISTDVITNFAKSCSIYTDEDFKDAIRQASEEDFSWQFKDVLKGSNMQRLLSNLEIRMRKQKDQEENLTKEQKELMEFGDAQGWNWTSESQLPW
ncbi:MAG: hypothetical protein ACI4NV_06910 [Thermoguttaceae bacterium]